MKKKIGKYAGLIALLLICVLGCGKIEEHIVLPKPAEEKNLEEARQERGEASEAVEERNLEEARQENKEGSEFVQEENVGEELREKNEVDVDLTILSATMVYSEVYNIMLYPNEYVGKTIKMRGLYSVYYDESVDKYYHACIISDATACCAQGIEFELKDEGQYPDENAMGIEEICVIGRFDTYQEDECTYCTLRDAVIVQ